MNTKTLPPAFNTYLSGGIFILCNLLMLASEPQLLQFSVVVILKLQALKIDTLPTIALILSNIMPMIPLGIIFFTITFRPSKIDAFYSLSQIIFTAAGVSLIKIMLQYPRPWMASDKVASYYCGCSFGVPCASVALISSLFLVLRKDIKPILKGISIKEVKPWIYTVLSVLGFVFTILEVLIKLFAGQHGISAMFTSISLSLFIHHYSELFRMRARRFLFKAYNKVRHNRLSRLCSLAIPTLLSVFAYFFVVVVSRIRTRDYTATEMANISSKCDACFAGGPVVYASFGLNLIFYFPGMFLCFTMMSYSKSTRKLQELSWGQKILRLLCVTFFKLWTFLGYFYVLKLRFADSQLTRLGLQLVLLFSPVVAFGLPGHLMKMCGLDIMGDFIQKEEDPEEDNATVLITDFFNGGQKSEVWDITEIHEMEDELAGETLRFTEYRATNVNEEDRYEMPSKSVPSKNELIELKEGSNKGVGDDRSRGDTYGTVYTREFDFEDRGNEDGLG